MKKILKIVCCLVIFSLFSIVPTKTFAVTGPENPYSFSVVSGEQSGSITIRWYDDGSTKQYNLLYGTDPNHYSYGVVKLPYVQDTSNIFTVNDLTPGQTYYFTLIGLTKSVPKYSGPIATQATFQTTNMQTSINHLPQYGFTAQTGDVSGTVKLSWTDNNTANKYDIVYGKTPQTLIYGLENMPFTQNGDNAYTVGALQAGQVYYFSLVAEKNGSIILWSIPIRAVAR